MESKSITYLEKIITLVVGNAGAQILLIFSTFFFARIYDEVAFGYLGYLTAFTGIISVVLSGRFENVYLRVRFERIRSSLIFIPLVSCLLIGLIGGVCFIYARRFFPLDGYVDLPIAAFLIASFLTVLFKFFTQHLISKNQFSAAANAKLVQAITIILGQLIFYKSEFGLIYGVILGLMTSVLMMFFTLKIRRFLPLKIIYLYVKKFKNFPIYEMPSAFVNALSANFNIFLIGIFFSVSSVGYFALAYRIVMLPASLFGVSIGQAFFSEITKDDSDYAVLVFNTALKATLFIAGPAIGLIFFAQPVFEVLLGSDWQVTGQIVCIIAPTLITNFAISPLSYVFSAKDLQRLDFLMMLLLVFLRGIGFLVPAYYLGFLEAILGYSLMSTLFFVIYGTVAFYLANVRGAFKYSILVVPSVIAWAMFFFGPSIEFVK